MIKELLEGKKARDTILTEKEGRWEVQMRIGGEWENIWTEDEKPLTFASKEEAKKELDNHFKDMEDAVKKGDMIDMDDREDFRIVRI